MLRRQNMTKVEVYGLKELEQNLMAVGKIPATKAGQDAMLASAEIMEVAISTMAPSSDGAGTAKSWMQGKGRRVKTAKVTDRGWGPRKFGTTYESWGRQSAFYGKLKDNIVSRIVPADKPGQVKVATGTGNAFWGLFIERGTKVRTTGKRGGMKANRGRMTAQPFMTPAFVSAAPRVLSILGAQIAHSLRRVIVLDRMKRGLRK